MAGINTNSRAQALARLTVSKVCPWCDTYTGLIEDLIGAGLIERHQLPGQPGMNKVVASFYDGILVPKYRKAKRRDERYLSIEMKGVRRAMVRVGLYAEVQQERLDMLRDGYVEHRKREDAAKVATARLQRVRTTHAAYRSAALFTFDSMKGLVDQETRTNKEHGFSYDSEALDEIANLFAEIRGVLETGTTLLNRKRHAEVIQNHFSVIARADDRFVSMMESLQALPYGDNQAEAENV